MRRRRRAAETNTKRRGRSRWTVGGKSQHGARQASKQGEAGAQVVMRPLAARPLRHNQQLAGEFQEKLPASVREPGHSWILLRSQSFSGSRAHAA